MVDVARLKVVALVLSVLLAGCATVPGEWRWVHPTKATSDPREDREACETSFRVSPESARKTGAYDDGLSLENVIAIAGLDSELEDARRDYVWRCMERLGYERRWYGEDCPLGCERRP